MNSCKNTFHVHGLWALRQTWKCSRFRSEINAVGECFLCSVRISWCRALKADSFLLWRWFIVDDFEYYARTQAFTVFRLRHSTLSTHFILSRDWNLKERMLNCHVICNIFFSFYLFYDLIYILFSPFFSFDTISFTAFPCNSAAKLGYIIRIEILVFLLIRESRELRGDLKLDAGYETYELRREAVNGLNETAEKLRPFHASTKMTSRATLNFQLISFSSISFSWKVLIEIVRNVWISQAVYSQLPSHQHHFGVLCLTQNVKIELLRRRIQFEYQFLHTTIATQVSSNTTIRPTPPAVSTYATVHSSTLTTIIIIAVHYDAFRSMCFMCANIYFIWRSFHSVPDTRPSTHPCTQMHNIMHHLFCETLQIYSSKVLLQRTQCAIVGRDVGIKRHIRLL